MVTSKRTSSEKGLILNKVDMTKMFFFEKNLAWSIIQYENKKLTGFRSNIENVQNACANRIHIILSSPFDLGI